jgi:phospholipid/cholesterol/gamma-HCH transport system substrate-binding protein
MVARVESGPGTLHGLVYRDDAAELVAHAEKAVDQLAAVVGEVEHGKGMLHSLVYEDQDRRNLVENLTEASRILRKLGEEIDAGKGTVGALLKDPSAYEDLKIILGNVKRNRMLRALIRFTIVKDDVKAGPIAP